MITEQFRQWLLTYWTAQQKKLFPRGLPKKDVPWSDPSDILRVLNVLALEPRGNHIYTPQGGWDNLRQSHLSAAPGYIELGFTTPKRVKAGLLILVNFGEDSLWNYFQIIIGEQTLSEMDMEAFHHPNRLLDILYEIAPMGYEANEESESKDGSFSTPETITALNPNFGRNSFVIASPASAINQILLRDETLPQRLDFKGFRDYIQELINWEKKTGKSIFSSQK